MAQIFVYSALGAAFLIALLIPLAPRIGLVDRPDDRKKHAGAIPLVGGPAVFIAMLPVFVVSGMPGDWGAALLAAGLLCVVGALDDAIRVGPIVRLCVQAMAVFVVAVAGNAVITSLGELGYGGTMLTLGFLAPFFTIFCGIGLINAVNMSDGLDGLSGSLALVALAALGFVAASAGRMQELTLIVGLMGALVGFLIYNARLPGRKQAHVFLGDSGSYFVGLMLFYLVVRLSQGPEPAMSPVIALWILLVPLFDTVAISLRRLRKGRSPFVADREHIHHVFLLAGFTVSETVLIMAAIGGLAAATGLVGYYNGVPDWVMMVGFLLLAGGYYRLVSRAWTFMRFLNRSISRRRNLADRRSGRERRVRYDPDAIAAAGGDRRSGQDRRRAEDRRHELPPEPPKPKLALVGGGKDRQGGGKAAARTAG